MNSPPRLVAVYFGADPRWQRMARVLEHTAAVHCPGWQVSVERIEPDVVTGQLTHGGVVPNAQKLLAWDRIVQGSEDGDRILLVDADTFVLRSLDRLWRSSAALQYTVRDYRYPINAGVIGIRVNDRTRRFMSSWVRAQRTLLGDAALHQQLRRQYGGAIGQASFAYALARQPDLARRKIPCQQWNCESSTWAKLDARTRMVHLVRSARRALFEGGPSRPAIDRVLDLWRQAERAAIEAAA